MNKVPETVTLPRDELLRDSKRQATSMALPLAVHHRLDLLARLAVAANATRAEIIGMLISEAKLDAIALEDSIVAYRKASVGDVVPSEPRSVDKPEDSNVVTLPVRHAGRPVTRRNAAV